ncbi:MAG TPA: aspartate aminotransferase family protein [Alphaproteobacteria bacterium]|nr:aspartate aminotransferase family protein [Alphaproteobacteria bacterium]
MPLNPQFPVVLPTYKRAPLSFAKGEGAYLFGNDGKKYLDFVSGIAVTAFGHNHPHLIQALTTQAQQLWHCSNLFEIPGQEKLAKRLVENSFAESVFFSNSGVEAIECGFKIIRKYYDEIGQPQKYRLITFAGAFHGRTLAALAATGQEKYSKGYDPVVEGFDQVAFGNLNELRAAITPETAGILFEPVQGEGGMRALSPEYLQEVRKIADEFGLLLFLDEIQCGMGRTGKLFAHEWAGIKPDLVAVAKGLGGGFPIGACLTTAKVGGVMQPGSHGSTFGGNPLAMAVGNAALDILLKPGFMKHVQEIGQKLIVALEGLVQRFPKKLSEVRGKGLMIGIKCVGPNTEFVDHLRLAGMLSVTAGDNIVRLLPPLIIEESHINQAIAILTTICQK